MNEITVASTAPQCGGGASPIWATSSRPDAQHRRDGQQEEVFRGILPPIVSSRPAVIVPPERETPGIRASAWAKP